MHRKDNVFKYWVLSSYYQDTLKINAIQILNDIYCEKILYSKNNEYDAIVFKYKFFEEMQKSIFDTL